MPRVHIATRRRAVVKNAMVCRHCGKEIGVGQQYYSWEKRYGGKQFTHVECGRPSPTMLSDRKTARIEEAVLGLTIEFSPEIPADWDGNTESLDFDAADVVSQLESVSEVAREVGEEYEESADNMPESLQYGSQAEAMREVNQELESWADTLESFEPNNEPEWPERGEDESDDSFRAKVQEALDDWAQQVCDEAYDLLGDIPEYQG